MSIKGVNTVKKKKKKKKHMSSINHQREYHVIHNGVKDIYRDIIKRFIDTFGIDYFGGNNYLNLVRLNVITEVESGGLPVDYLLRTAPLSPETKRKIEESTVYIPGRDIDTKHINAKKFSDAKERLLVKVTELMRDICFSLREENKMPDDLDKKMDQLSKFITGDFSRDVFVDQQAKVRWKKDKDPFEAKMLENCIQQVEEMLRKIAGEGTIQLVIHWGQWAFRVSEGLRYKHL